MPITESPLIATIVPTEPARADLTLAFNAIQGKRKDLDTLFSYLDGPQPLKYSTEKLKELFQNINAHFEENLCAVVVDAVLDRLELTGFKIEGDDAATEKLKVVFDKLHLDLEADNAHQASLATSQSYIIVWKDDTETVVYYNDPRLCHVFYEDANPRKKRFAAKWFTHTDGRQEITLYYVDRLEHWVSAKSEGGIDKPTAFVFESQETNTFGVIPVFELKTPGEIFRVLTLQDAINVLLSDMMTASEFGALQQKYIISNADVSGLKNSPNEIWSIPAGDGVGQQTSVGEFTASPLSNFSNEIDRIGNKMFIITRTPKHYLMDTGANISGEALLAMEAPLTKKVSKRQKQLGAQWQDIAAFIAQLEGVDVEPDQVTPMWKRPESVQPLTEMQVVQTGTGAGVDLETMLLHEGWDQAEIDAMKKRKEANLKKRINTMRVPVEVPNDTNGDDNARQSASRETPAINGR